MKSINRNIYLITVSGMSVVLTAICSYISIPFTIPFNLQTFAVSLMFFCLPFNYGMLSITAYILLGLIGIPVFSGFSGGAGVLLGPTGGYIIGFLFMGFVYYAFTRILKTKYRIIGMFSGLLVCYISGTLWFFISFAGGKGILSILSVCVFPFIIPDTVKIFLAFLLSKRIKAFKAQ